VKKVIVYSVSLLMMAFVQGCSLFSGPSTPEVSTQSVAESNDNPKLSRLVGKNYVKGVVTSLKRDSTGTAWNYVIDGIDTSNGKLPYVNFNHKTVLANEGDLVHASFDGNKLTEMLVLRAGYYKGGKIQDTKVQKKPVAEKGAGKRDKAHQVLSVPQEEYIKLH